MNIPAISYMNCVRQFALANGYKFFTLKEMKRAIAAYEIYGALRN
jgi:hypothetical protein